MHQAQVLAKEGYKQYRIAEILGVTDRTVRNYLSGNSPKPGPRKKRKSKLDHFKSHIRSVLEEEPLFNCEVLHRNLKAMGYTGGISILRDFAKETRDEIQREVVRRFETQAGYQAQMDWKVLPKEHWRGISAFVMVLGYSRTPYVRFTSDMTSGTLLACHQKAFEYFGGIPQTVLYDNMKTAWVYNGDEWKTNSRLLEFASSYGFSPRRCAVRRPQTKGKVERFIDYLSSNFLAEARRNDLKTIEELNDAILPWLAEVQQKELRDYQESRAERYEVEKSFLQPFPPEGTFDYRDSIQLIVSREGSVTFKTNKYSVPPELVGKKLTLKIDALSQRGEILNGTESIRQFNLLPAGSRQKDIRNEDREALFALWEKQRKKSTKKPARKQQEEQTIVDIRNPAYYEQFAAIGVSV